MGNEATGHDEGVLWAREIFHGVLLAAGTPQRAEFVKALSDNYLAEGPTSPALPGGASAPPGSVGMF